MIQCSFYECFISLVKQCFLFTWAYVHVLRDTATHLQCFTYEMLETSFTSISLSLCQNGVMFLESRESDCLNTACSRLWDGVSPVCFHAVFRWCSSPFTQCSLSCGTLTHTSTCRCLILFLLLRQAPKSWFPPQLWQKPHTESSQLIWGCRRALSPGDCAINWVITHYN